MQFKHFVESASPAADVFKHITTAVFDKGDCSEHIERISHEARTLYLVWCFHGEIFNGGFDQFFTNSLGDHSREILHGLKHVGAHHAHDLLNHAMAWFPHHAPDPNRHQRWEQYRSFCDTPAFQARITQLNEHYYEGRDDMEHLLNEYIRKQPHAWIRTPEN